MDYPHRLVTGRILDRRKRFLADVEIDGERVVAHLANTGAMTGCWTPGGPCRLTRSDAPHRKLAWSVEQTWAGHWVLVNTARPNRIVEEAILAGLPELGPIQHARREPALPDGGRADLLLDGRIWVEVKNATLVQDDVVLFPDAPTARGRGHLRALTARVEAGDRAVLFLHVGAEAGAVVRPADALDPAFGLSLREAIARGVEVYARRARLTEDGVTLGERVPFEA